jgi:hypothetical protein
MRPSVVCPGVFTDAMLQSGGATTCSQRLNYEGKFQVRWLFCSTQIKSIRTVSFAERKADWCSVQLEKFFMPILEEGPNSMIFQRDGGSALQFESCWIESSEDRDHQTQPYHLAISVCRLKVHHLISTSSGTQLTEISIIRTTKKKV